MNFSEAVGEVAQITARPDKLAEIGSAINFVISHMSLKAHFAYDLVEATIPINGNEYGATIQFNNLTVSPLVTRFRKFKYIKRYGQIGYLTPMGSDKILTHHGSMQRDTYYIAGNNLTYILRDLAPSLEIGYYQHPPVLSENDTYWMLDLIPYAVIDKAAARIFRSIGDDESQRQYEASGEDLYKAARRDFEDAVTVGAR